MADNPFPVFVFYNILIGLVLSLIMGWVAILIARRLNLIDIPGSLPHKIHTIPTPLAGGIAIVLALLVGGLVFNFSMVRALISILLPALIIFAIGLWDDFKPLPAWIKLTGQFVAAVVLIALGTFVQIIPEGFMGLPGKGNILLDWIITLFWIIGITNAFNLVDSTDGLVLGTSGLALAFLILVTLDSPQTSLLQLLTLLLGICIGLYFYNHNPAHLFLGDSGAQTLGFLLAAIGIQFTPGVHPIGSSWFIPILIFGVPIFDTTLVTISRIRRREQVYNAGLDHTYHRLVNLGLESSQSLFIMHLATVVLGCLAFITLQLVPLYANIIFGLTCMIGLALNLPVGSKKMIDLSPHEKLERIFHYWWILAALAIIGGTAGWIFCKFQPTNYEATGVFEVSLDQQQLVVDGVVTQDKIPLDFITQDAYLSSAADIFYAPDVKMKVLADAQQHKITLDEKDFSPTNFFLDRRGLRWLITVRSTNPVTAAQLADIWLTDANIALLDAKTHEAQALSLGLQHDSIQKCFSEFDFTQANQCAGTKYSNPEELNTYLNSLQQQITIEQQAGRGIGPALDFVITHPAEQPSSPVLYTVSLIILAGCFVGLLSGVLVVGMLPTTPRRK